MHDFERLGVFYLGKQYDLAAGKPQPGWLLYDSKDLTTHAVCVGMTGSGKTGLCLTLLEEAAIDGIPVIAIDPKGDVGNLLLSFPSLRGEDFRPWVEPAEAAARGLSPEQLAEQTATQWREGLAAWDEDGERVARFRNAVDATIYTPGSTAGQPLSVLHTLSAPPAAVLGDTELLRQRIGTAVSGLLSLLGIDADPLRSREHILLATLIDQAWREGRDVALADLIRGIQSPPVDRIGVMDLESFFPAKERFALALQLNNLIASPGFAAWLTGEPLDIQRLLYTDAGRPRLSILSIAHLSDAERMFFVSVLLNEIVAWMRKQPGTSSLRAILYMDEVFGFFPPTANPPSKQPMLMLLKQARAFGLGIVLATQNPVDLDYKGLSNAGTWFLGRLQTERDKARVLDGLEGAAATTGSAFDRARMEAVLSGLRNRVFLMNNVHDQQPVVFQTRWTLSYLRGPLTEQQIRTLVAPPAGAVQPSGAADPLARAPAAALAAASARPVLPPGIAECFWPHRGKPAAGGTLVYRPAVLGEAKVHYAQAKAGVDTWESLALRVPADAEAGLDWDAAEVLPREDVELENEPAAGAGFVPPPVEVTQPKRFSKLAQEVQEHLYCNRSLELFKCAALKAVSQPGESEAEFRVRLAQTARERRDMDVEKLRSQYAPKLAALEEQIRRARQRVEKQKSAATQQTFQNGCLDGRFDPRRAVRPQAGQQRQCGARGQ